MSNAMRAIVVLSLAASLYSCKDMGRVPAVPVLGASSLSVTLSPGGSTTVTINGGNPPYVISRQPDASLATASLTNNANGTGSLTIQATTSNVSGTTSVRVKDTDADDSPSGSASENEIEIEIRISATVVSFSGQVQPIFTNSCVNAGCHPGGGAPFPLNTGQSYARLVNQLATTGPCAGDMRVLPGNPANSALVKRLEGTCGDQMPLGGSPLPAASIQLVKDWIAQGALNN